MNVSALSEWIFAYVSMLLGGILFCVFYTEIRRRRFEPKGTDDNVFRCSECAYVYTDDLYSGSCQMPAVQLHE